MSEYRVKKPNDSASNAQSTNEPKVMIFNDSDILQQSAVFNYGNNADGNTVKNELDKTIQNFEKKTPQIKKRSSILDASDIIHQVITEALASEVGIFLDLMSSNQLAWIYSHSVNVALLSTMAAIYYKYKSKDIYTLARSALLHDIGMVLIPNKILNKEGKLTDTEFAIVSNHPELGNMILEQRNTIQYDPRVILQHHERLDGSGYPRGMKAAHICHEAKIIMVADALDSATTDRAYRPAKDMETVFMELFQASDQYPKEIALMFYDAMKG